MKRVHRKEKAFGLVEIILGIFVLTSALTVVMLPVTRSIQTAANDRNSIIAEQLAQEGIELVRNIRDNRFARATPNGADLRDTFPSVSQGGNNSYCNVTYLYSGSSTPATSFQNGSACSNGKGSGVMPDRTKMVISGNFYTINTGSSNPLFYRRIDVSTPNNTGNQYNVIVFVTWGDNGSGTLLAATTNNCIRANRCVFTRETLANWNYWTP